jgi:hypothetical protein
MISGSGRWCSAPSCRPRGGPFAQPGTNAITTVADPEDRTGTNPGNLRSTLEVSNDFQSIDDELFADQVT